LFAAGPKFILVSFIIYAPASILFVMTRREQGPRLLSPAKLAILAVSIVGAIVGVVALATGRISIRAFMTDLTPLRRQARYT
jgi:arginine:ornithine antiporter / lysine permease